MRKAFIASTLVACVILSGQYPSGAQQTGSTMEPHFEVLSPWAEADPITPRAISTRLDTLSGKKIGLFANFKRASRPIVAEVSRHLKETYPGLETSLFDSRGANVVETETDNREQFIAWMKEVDAVVLAVGD